MQATIAALAARKCSISPGDCLIVDAMLIKVAIAPGPNMIGIARGTNATLALPSSARGTMPPDGGGLNRSNPNRVGDQPSSGLIARQLAKVPANWYASPRYLEQSGEPTHPDDLVQHERIGFTKAGSWTLYRGSESLEVQVGGRFVLNGVGMFRRLATLDQGIIMLPEQVVSDDLAMGRLRRILPDWRGAETPVYALTETRLLPTKTQRFIEFLQEHLGRI